MGNWSGLAVNTTMVGTSNGFANATFGWVSDGFSGNSSTLTAASANNLALNDASSIHFQSYAPSPDAIVISANPDTIPVGSGTSLITAQIYRNGAPYHCANVPIGFASTNDTIAFLPFVKDNVTDANGQAMIVPTSNMNRDMSRYGHRSI
jgi:hypothetical protein